MSNREQPAAFVKAVVEKAQDEGTVTCTYPLFYSEKMLTDLFLDATAGAHFNVLILPSASTLSVRMYLWMRIRFLSLILGRMSRKLLWICFDRPVRLFGLKPRHNVAIIYLLPNPDPRAVAQEVNVELQRVRNTYRLPPLAHSERLALAADSHCEDSVKKTELTHVGSNGETPLQRAHLFGYPRRIVAEATALGLVDARSIVNAWMLSKNHRSIVLNPNLAEVGVSQIRLNRTHDPILVAVFGGGELRPIAELLSRAMIRSWVKKS